MQDQFSRTQLLLGKDNIDILKKSKVAIFGIGGVGSYVLEALARTGIGTLIIVDKDVVDVTNINRQLIADHTTIGKDKVEVAKERISKINPDCNVIAYKEFFGPETQGILTEDIDYIVDAVDNVTAKIELVVRANKMGIPIISSMGTGFKLDPTRFEISDIYKTEVCPLAKVMRKELKKRDIKHLKVVYSKEEPVNCNREVTGSVPFVPSVAGLIIASEVVKDLLKDKK